MQNLKARTVYPRPDGGTVKGTCPTCRLPFKPRRRKQPMQEKICECEHKAEEEELGERDCIGVSNGRRAL